MFFVPSILLSFILFCKDVICFTPFKFVVSGLQRFRRTGNDRKVLQIHSEENSLFRDTWYFIIEEYSNHHPRSQYVIEETFPR